MNYTVSALVKRETIVHKLKIYFMGPLGMAGIEAGGSLLNNVFDVAFAGVKQRQQLRGQKQALKQQNEAALDMWNKTNYSAQVAHMKQAGLNPGLIYGMGGSGGQLGSASAMPSSQGASYGIGTQSILQAALLKAQKENIEADTQLKNVEATKKAGVDTDVAVGSLNKIIAETKNETAKGVLLGLDAELKRIETNIADSSQWYHIGKFEADWQKSIEEFRSAAAKANVDQATVDESIKLVSAELAIKYLSRKAIAKGMQVSDAQINALNGQVISMMRNAESGTWNAESNARNAGTNKDRLDWDKIMHRVADDLKLGIETVQDVFQALIIKGATQSGGK